MSLLEQADLAEEEIDSLEEEDGTTSAYKTELEWLLVSKATVQTYGLLLDIFLEQTIPLSNDIWYWDKVLGSYVNTGLYVLQGSPWRFWGWAREVLDDAREKCAGLRESPGDAISASNWGENLMEQWKQFYGLVRKSVQDKSVMDIQRRVMSPIAMGRSQARQNQVRLRRFKEMSASGLGLLVDEAMTFNIDEDVTGLERGTGDSQEWKGVVERSVALMDTVVCNVATLDGGVPELEELVFASMDDDPEISSRRDGAPRSRPEVLAKRLQEILKNRLPYQAELSQGLVSTYGRPSRIVRYWLPATLLLLSSTTILRMVANRRAEIITWLRDLGTTTRDFWYNWVIEPTKKIIGTIRHDKESEVAIMSKESLKGDRDSLERMVVDFAVDNPEAANLGNRPLTETQISEIRAKVQEGDLTPVLRAYERDLRKPFKGTIRGDLVRTLLIQVQKTKVDVEVAISGIDALLKSQELVFGFIGLTPGILVCFALFRYFGGFFSRESGSRKGEKAGQTVRVLRNIDRILTQATPTENNLLSYTDHGLLLCEVHVLRKCAHSLFPGEIVREFVEDVNDLCNINSGIQVQLRVLERIRWAYSRWCH